MKIIPALLFLLSCHGAAVAQTVYEKDSNETIKSFITRKLLQPGNKMMHQVIAGKWGNDTLTEKVIVFYKVNEEAEETQAIVLQHVSGNVYRKLPFDVTFGTGLYPRNAVIESVFFYDTDDNGTREMVVVESGSVRCMVEVTELNRETGKQETVMTGATCGMCSYRVFGQNASSGEIDQTASDEGEWKCNSRSIKSILKEKQR